VIVLKIEITVLSFTNSTVAPFLESFQQSSLCLEYLQPPLVPGGKLLDLGINMATWEPFFIPLGTPVFAVAGLASVIDPDAAAWINGAAADILVYQHEYPSSV
jgi:hypothetical protein